MSFSGELKGFAKGFRGGVDTWAKIEDIRKNRKWRESDLEGGSEFPAAPVPESGAAPQASPDGGAGGGGGGGGTGVGGNAFAEQAYKHFRSKGLSHAAAAGIVGNLMVESGGAADVLSGYRLGDQGTAGYAAQWREGRLINLKKFAQSRGHEKPTIEDQLDFVMEEGNAKSPYAEQGAVKAFQLLGTAKTVEEATKFFMDNFERPNPKYAHLDQRVAHSLRLSDTGGSSVAAAATDTTGGAAGGSTEETEEDPIKEEPAAEEQDVSFDSGSKDLRLEMNPIVATNFATPQVETQFDLDVGGLSPPRDDEARPAMFAARGGAIPEPTQHLQAGGYPLNPSGNPDKFNPSRQYTQPTAKPATTSNWAPRRIGMGARPISGAGAATGGAGGVSASQQKFRDMRAQQAAAAAAAAAAKAQAPAQTGDWQTAMKNQQMADRMRTAAMSRGSSPYGHRDVGQMTNQRAVGAYNDYATAVQQAQKQARASGQDPWMAQQMVDPNKYRTKYGFGRGYAEGGVIPDPEEDGEEIRRSRMDSVWEEEEAPRTRMDSVWPQTRGAVLEEGEEEVEENFARGGKVSDRDATFKRLLRAETRPGSSRDDGGQGARDRAAKRLSALEGRPTSSAYSAAGDSEYWTPRTAKPGKKTTKPGEKGKPSKEKAKPDEKEKPAKAEPELRQPAGTPALEQLEPKPFEEDRLTRERGGINDPRAGEMRERQPRAGAVPEPEEPVVPDDRATREPGPDVAVTETDSGWRKRRVTPPLVAEPVVEEPAAPLPAIVGRPPPPESVRPFQQLPDTTLPPGSVATPPPEVQGPPAEAATPGPAWFGGNPVPPPGSPGPQLPEQGVWINGQFVPLSSLQGGGNFAAGGVVPEEDEEPISPRAESANYTTSAPASAATRGRPAPAATPTEEPASAPAAEERPKADLQPTPKLMAHVQEAARGGARYLNRVFGLDGQGDGAVPTPESGAAREDGIRRFASREGAATPAEINEIDDQIDPNRELSEGDRQMTRMAKITQFYLERGRKDEAEAAAASLLQYGAKRFGQLGSLAQAAYSQYEQTGDKQHLQKATQFLSQAYGMIPDGGSMSVTVDPETGKFQAVRINAEGEEETYDVSSDQLPGLIRQTMDGSAYWQQVTRLGDPEGAKSRDVDRRERARQDRLDERAAESRAASRRSGTAATRSCGREGG